MGVLMPMKYFTFSLLLTSFVAATLGFGVLAGMAALICRAVFAAAFVAMGAILALARVHTKPFLRGG